MSTAMTPSATNPARFDVHQGNLHGIPAELTEMIHEYMVLSDGFSITTKDSRTGMLGPVRSQGARTGATAESTFSFSTRYSSVISNRATFDEYRRVAQRYIIDELKVVFINVEDLQFANARKFLKTLYNRGKLQDFVIRRDQLFQPVDAPRKMIFRNVITKKFSGDSSKVEKFSKVVESLSNNNEDFYMHHVFRGFRDGVAIRKFITDLVAVPVVAARPRPRDLIVTQLRRCVNLFDEQKAAKDNETAQRRLDAQQVLADYREQDRREAEEQYLQEMRGEYEDNVVVGSDFGDELEVEEAEMEGDVGSDDEEISNEGDAMEIDEEDMEIDGEDMGNDGDDMETDIVKTEADAVKRETDDEESKVDDQAIKTGDDEMEEDDDEEIEMSGYASWRSLRVLQRI